MPTPTSAQRGPLRKCQGQGWVCTICPVTGRGQRSFPNFKAALNHERTAHSHGPSALKDEGNADGADGMVKSEDRQQTADEACWDKLGPSRLTSEGLRQWEMHAHVDHVFDLVPFWQRGIDAAEKGEVLRLEEFLEKMEGDGGWRTTNEVLGMLGGWKASPSDRARDHEWGQRDWAAGQRGAWESNAIGWGAGPRSGWSAASTRIPSGATESSYGRDSGWGIQEKWAEGGPELKTGRGKNGGWGGHLKAVCAAGGSGGREELRHFVDAIARQEAVNEERRKQMHLFFEMSMEQKIQKIEETIRFLRTHG